MLFKGEMVRAILAGSKTQTRRVVKPQPNNTPGVHHAIEPYRTSGGDWNWVLAATGHGWDVFACPYGKPGDRLWVKETWRPHDVLSPWDLSITYAADGAERYVNDGEFGERDWNMPKAAATGNVTPLFMPRWASRITLEITEVRVEQIRSISAKDILAEGAVLRAHDDEFGHNPVSAFDGKCYVMGLRSLWAAGWNSINAKRAPWESNPWVWAISFKRIPL